MRLPFFLLHACSTRFSDTYVSRRFHCLCVAPPRSGVRCCPTGALSHRLLAAFCLPCKLPCLELRRSGQSGPPHRGTRPGRPLGGSSVVPGSAVSVSLSLTWTFTSYTPGDVHVAFYYPPVKCILFMFHCAVTSIFLYEFRSKGCQNHGLNRL